MFQLGPHKAPGLDGIPAFFYQEYWSTVKSDVINIVQAFFHSGSLFRSLNHTFITLIPKVTYPKEVTHFRPISLCNVLYKIISKILVNRLKPLMDKLITPFQNAFIKGRNISDNILIAHEIMYDLRRKRGKKFSFGALKIDMSIAYDKVRWNFLKAVLVVMKFESKWIKWIMECVTSVQFTLLINGHMSKSFTPTQGLRQGDHLSPYLFLFCANILSISLTQAETLNKLKGVKVGRNGISFTHLLFADDSLLFFKKDMHSVDTLLKILDWYCKVSGQSINPLKSDLFCKPNMPMEDQEALARKLKVNLVHNPTKYLGLEFKLKGNKIADFHFLVEKLQSKLQGWKARLLSQAGRTTLISSMLQYLPLYTFSCFKVPDQVCNELDTIIRAFWWGHGQGEKKLHLLSWEKICQPKRKGGLGIKKFGPMNYVMLAKQYWNLYQNPNSLLARTYKAKYYPNCSLQEYTPKSHHSWCWKNIVKQGDFRLREGQWRVGSGFNIPLTHQNWFPSSLGNLLHLEIQTGTVGDLIDHNSITWKADLVRTLYCREF